MTAETHSNAHGTNLARARADVGPQDASTPCEPVSAHRGSVPDKERERLAATFGAELVKLRKDNRLSQAKLGDLAGLRGDHLGRLERGQRRPTVAAIQALARVLVPEADRTAVEQHLAHAAGYSLREGTARKRQAREHRDRRLALASSEKALRLMRNRIRVAEARGEIVSGTYRSIADSTEQIVARLKAQQAAEPKGIPGYEAMSSRPASRRKADILEWASGNPRLHTPKTTNHA